MSTCPTSFAQRYMFRLMLSAFVVVVLSISCSEEKVNSQFQQNAGTCTLRFYQLCARARNYFACTACFSDCYFFGMLPPKIRHTTVRTCRAGILRSFLRLFCGVFVKNAAADAVLVYNSSIIPYNNRRSFCMAENKTNAMRMLDRAKVPYTPHTYETDG